MSTRQKIFSGYNVHSMNGKANRKRVFIFLMVLVFGCQKAVADTHYVSLSGSHVSPYTNWVTAATTIQDAVNAAASGDLVLVTNGTYASGGALTPEYALPNRVVITNAITVQSVNGPQSTMIQGQGPAGNSAVRCVYMSAGILSGFTLTNGYTRYAGNNVYERSGGGVHAKDGGLITNCVIIGNHAYQYGGGTYAGTLNHCTISGNSALYGGGIYYGTLNHCTISGNSAEYSGGGAYDGTLNHCTISGNSANSYGGGTYYGTINHCTISENSAYYGGGTCYGTFNHSTIRGNSANSYGGGAYYGTFNHSTIHGNSAVSRGGGTYQSTINNSTISANRAKDGGGSYDGIMNNCTISANRADDGGGVYNGMINNCIVYYNHALDHPNYYNGTLNYSCTTPDPGGVGNITD